MQARADPRDFTPNACPLARLYIPGSHARDHRLKHARITQSITAALRERGTDELTARLRAEMGMLAFSVAFERWMKANDDEAFPPFADAALSDLQARAAEFVLPSRLVEHGFDASSPGCEFDVLRSQL
jgi:hypothetical protein